MSAPGDVKEVSGILKDAGYCLYGPRAFYGFEPRRC